MKNILSTMIVFGVIFILLIIGAFIFDKFDGFGLINNIDNSINQGLNTLLNDNDSSHNSTDNIIMKNGEPSDHDNISNTGADNGYGSMIYNKDNETVFSSDNLSNNINSDNTSMDNYTN